MLVQLQELNENLRGCLPRNAAGHGRRSHGCCAAPMCTRIRRLPGFAAAELGKSAAKSRSETHTGWHHHQLTATTSLPDSEPASALFAVTFEDAVQGYACASPTKLMLSKTPEEGCPRNLQRNPCRQSSCKLCKQHRHPRARKSLLASSWVEAYMTQAWPCRRFGSIQLRHKHVHLPCIPGAIAHIAEKSRELLANAFGLLAQCCDFIMLNIT